MTAVSPFAQMLVLYVQDQDRARAFWQAALASAPFLDAPGMTAFSLPAGGSLGLMPVSAAERLLGPGVVAPAAGGQPQSRAELYLHVDDPVAAHTRALAAGAVELDPVRPRDWGDAAGYCHDPDGHVLAFARPL